MINRINMKKISVFMAIVFISAALPVQVLAATDIENSTITGISLSYTYTGAPIEPEPTISLNGQALLQDTDYTLSYTENLNVGTAFITVTGINNYSGTLTVNFEILPLDLIKAKIHRMNANYTYTGFALTQEPLITLNGATLIKDTDYTLSFTDNIDAGKALMTVTGINNYSGTLTETFEILPLDIRTAYLGGIKTSYTYTGSATTPEPIISVDDTTLIKDLDYILSYSDNTEVGTATITVTGKGNYDGTLTRTFLITSTQNAYVTGYGDDTVKPEANITRAEAAQLIYNISDLTASDSASFIDMQDDAWYSDALAALTGNGIISGYPDGTCKPGTCISRAEFTALIAQYAGLSTENGTSDFSDVPDNHWASGFISAAQDAGYISGYEDGSFRPNQTITRAEAIAIINQLQGVSCDTDSIANVMKNIKTFNDNQNTGIWYYYDIVAATNSFTYTLDKDGKQIWTNVN